MAATDCVRLLEQGTVENWELAGAPAQKLGAWWSSLEQLAASDALRVERYWNTEYQVPMSRSFARMVRRIQPELPEPPR